MSEALVHFARFGNRRGEHAVLSHSGVPAPALAEAKWLTDVPPQGDADEFGRFVTGYPLDGFYVMQSTAPDPTAPRRGMVLTTAAFVPRALAAAVAPERVLAFLSGANGEDVDASLAASTFSPETAHDHPPGAPALVSALLAKNRAVWAGMEGFDTAIACVWRHLQADERSEMVFGAAVHPDAIAVPTDDRLAILAVPRRLLSRWNGWPVVDATAPPVADPASDAFLGTTDNAARPLAQQLLGRPARFHEWRHVVALAEMTGTLSALDHEQLRAVLQLLGLLAHEVSSGVELKDEALRRLSELTPAAAFHDVRGLRGVPWDALPGGGLQPLLDAWTGSVMGDDARLGDAVAAIEESVMTDDAFGKTLGDALRRAVTTAPPDVVAGLAQCVLSAGAHITDWLVTASGPRAADRALSTAAIPNAPSWLVDLACRHGLPRTHAATVDAADAVAAWRAHTKLVDRPAEADALLARRTGPVGTIRAALAIGDRALTNLAAERVAADPSLLRPADLSNPLYLNTWAAVIALGGDPWAVMPPEDAASSLLDLVIEGGVVPSPLLEAMSSTRAADLSTYPRRQDVWHRLAPAARDRMLAASANALGRRLAPGDPKPEAPLENAILEPSVLGAIAHDDPRQAVLLIEMLRSLPEHAVIIAERGRFDAATATRLGEVVVANRWKRAAESLADLAAKRVDLRPAASRVSTLFSVIEKLRRLAWSDSIHSVASHGEVRDALHDIAAQLYPGGPADRSLWERAGGHRADCPDAATGRHRWGLALDAIEQQRAGAPSMPKLLGAMQDEYPNNENLAAVAEALRKECA